MSKRGTLLLCLLALCHLSALAQDFAWQAPVGPVNQSGYYQVPLMPEIKGYLQTEISDLRLYNSKGQEVPYVLRTDNRYTPLTGLKTDRTTIGKVSYLHVSFGRKLYPEQVRLFISGPPLYHRSAKIILGERKVYGKHRWKRRRRRHLNDVSMPILLESGTPALFKLPSHKTENLVIQIENGDDSPLGIDSVQVLQQDQYLVSYLKADHRYFLRFGDQHAASPDYDLSFFKDSIPPVVPTLPAGEVRPLKTTADKNPITQSTLLIWGAIGVVAIGLFFMTRQLVREMDKKKR